MEQNTGVIQEVKDDLDIDYEAQLAAIDKALEENARRIAELDKAIAEINRRKIFTLKELKEMELEKQREEKEKLEKEKRDIDAITSAALEEVQILRTGARTEEEKLIAEEKAVDMELKALLHDLEIRKMIVSDSECKLEDALASFAIEESLFEKNKKKSLTIGKKSEDYYLLREEIYKNRSRKNSYLDKYRELAKVLEKQRCKISEANKMLKEINAKLKINH